MSQPDASVAAAPDRERVREFAQELMRIYSAGMLSLVIDVGERVGLFEACAAGPGTSAQIAARAGLHERQVREWLGAMVTAGIVLYDPDPRVYSLPPEHAACLCGETPYNLAGRAGAVTQLAAAVGPVAGSFQTGAGVPYDAYMPGFTGMMDMLGRRRYDALLVSGYLARCEGLVDRLRSGMAVADVGCGSGHCLNLMAQAFPASGFTGYDISEDALWAGSAEAAAWKLGNASYRPMDIARLPAEPRYDLITAFDVVHDQVSPEAVLRCIREALAPGGVFFMVDVKVSSLLEENLQHPLAPYVYSISVLHCMQVSLAGGGPGLGTAWGVQSAARMLSEAGFSDVLTADAPMDPAGVIFVCRA